MRVLQPRKRLERSNSSLFVLAQIRNLGAYSWHVDPGSHLLRRRQVRPHHGWAVPYGAEADCTGSVRRAAYHPDLRPFAPTGQTVRGAGSTGANRHPTGHPSPLGSERNQARGIVARTKPAPVRVCVAGQADAGDTGLWNAATATGAERPGGGSPDCGMSAGRAHPALDLVDDRHTACPRHSSHIPACIEGRPCSTASFAGGAVPEDLTLRRYASRHRNEDESPVGHAVCFVQAFGALASISLAETVRQAPFSRRTAPEGLRRSRRHPSRSWAGL